MKQLRTIFIASLTIALPACSLLSADDPVATSVYASNNTAPKLYAYPYALQKTLNASIQTRFKTGETLFEANGQLKSDNHSVSLTFTSNNQVIWLIDYNGETINEVRTSEIPDELQAQDMLRDIALSFWPQSAISRQLKNNQLLQTEFERRVIDSNEKPLIQVSYLMGASISTPNGRIVVDNFAEDYQLILDCKKNF